jgi:hypothetical protein
MHPHQGAAGVQPALNRIEMMERILPGEEAEAAALLTQELKKLGVAVHTGMRMAYTKVDIKEYRALSD